MNVISMFQCVFGGPGPLVNYEIGRKAAREVKDVVLFVIYFKMMSHYLDKSDRTNFAPSYFR